MACGREKQVAISQITEMLSAPFVSDILCFSGFRMTCNKDFTVTLISWESKASTSTHSRGIFHMI